MNHDRSDEPLNSDRRCPRCGYLVVKLTSSRCPECGTLFDEHAVWARAKYLARSRRAVRVHMAVLAVMVLLSGAAKLGLRRGDLFNSVTTWAGSASVVALTLLLGWAASRAWPIGLRRWAWMLWLRTMVWLQLPWVAFHIVAWLPPMRHATDPLLYWYWVMTLLAPAGSLGIWIIVHEGCAIEASSDVQGKRPPWEAAAAFVVVIVATVWGLLPLSL
ncbi:MAG: hypothetical protein KAS72_12260 [Phycisphaerales bacterium]|nr:hypothetical protein [Phycisphaerales bacterium]